MAQHTFTPGVFDKFRATAPVHVGGAMLDLPTNAIVEFDGQTMKYGGKDYNVPALKGACNEGWLVKDGDTKTTYKPQPANITVRPALKANQEKGNEALKLETNADEKEIATVASFSDKREKINKGSTTPWPPKAEATPRTAADPEVTSKTAGDRGPIKSREGALILEEDPDTYHEVDYKLPKAKPQSSAGSNEDEVPVARLSNPATKKTLLTDPRAADAEILKLDNVKGNPGRPKVTKIATQPIPKVASEPSPDEGSGFLVSENPDPSLDPSMSSPPPPGFTWDKSGHWRDRVKTAVEKWGNNPEALEQIYAQESESVVKNIKSALSRQS